MQNVTLTAGTRVLTALAFLALILPVTAATAADDLVVFEPGNDPPTMSGGVLETQVWPDKVTYKNSETDAKKTLDAWTIRYVKFGYENLDDGWSNGFTNMVTKKWKVAAEAFSTFLRDLDKIKAARTDTKNKAYLFWATHYYAGLCWLETALIVDEVGRAALADINDQFPLDLSDSASRQRDRNMSSNDLERIKRLVKTKISAVASKAGGGGGAAQRDLQSAVDGAGRASELAEAINTNFPAFYRQFAAPAFEQALEFIRKPFLEPERDWECSRLKPFWMFRMRLVSARALMGLARYGEALGELNPTAEAADTPDGPQAVPARDQRDDPSLLYVVQDFTRNSRTEGYWHLVAEALFLTAEIYEAASDFSHARAIYSKIAKEVPQKAEFEGYRNEAQLRAALNLGRGPRGSYSRAERELKTMVGDFENVRDDNFLETYLLDPDKASLYAGAYLARAEIAYNEYRKTSATDKRQIALEMYLRVTAMFSADREKRAQALYKASGIYREIAEQEWAADWASKPEKEEDENGRPVFNPYHYYLKMADALRDELVHNYADTSWGRR